MSLCVFLALCSLGTGFMTYAFFQWTYGDKHGAGVRQIGAHKKAFRENRTVHTLSLHKGPGE